MQSTNLPAKYLVPFAKNDGAKVEIPVTTATAGRASQSLGFPPITGQPPEAGGLPPQLEDFNGAVNQIARVAWWAQLGGRFPFDNTFTTDSNIGGYPLGAEIPSSDNAGTWLSLAENNVANPDTVGTGWAPSRAYGVLALTGQTGGTTTPTPVQAMKRRITIAGTLTSNLTVILPNWLYSWDVTNNTSGAFTVTVKTAAGSGVVIPQNGAPTPITGDGTNIAQPANNVPLATSATQAAQLSQTAGRLIGIQTFTASGTYTPTAGTASIIVFAIGGGGGGGGTGPSGAGLATAGGGGGGGAYGTTTRILSGFAGTTVTVGGGGAGNLNGPGSAGTASSFGAFLVVGGGAGAIAQNGITPPGYGQFGGGGAAPTGSALSSGAPGWAGGNAAIYTTAAVLSGKGGDSPLGSGGITLGTSATGVGVNGSGGSGYGAGGSGGCSTAGGSNSRGGTGAGGIVIVYEYA